MSQHHSFKKKMRLNESASFRRLFSKGQLAHGEHVWVRNLPNTIGRPQLGLVLAKKKFLGPWTATV